MPGDQSICMIRVWQIVVIRSQRLYEMIEFIINLPCIGITRLRRRNDILLSIIGKLVGDIPLSGRHTGEELQRVQIDRH